MKVGCLWSMTSKVSEEDPCPQLPASFVDPERMKKMVWEIKGLSGPDSAARHTATLPRIRTSHHVEWLNAVREGRQADSPFEYGGRLSEIGLLGVIAIRMTGHKLQYDEEAMRFTNSDEANRWLTPTFRPGWSLG
jgi:hypothetical protein